MAKQTILNKIAREFQAGAHQRSIKDLPFEIQFQLGCSWGAALTEANRIRIRSGHATGFIASRSTHNAR